MRSLSGTIEIKASQRSRIDWQEIWLYRELFYFFAWRDIKVRYRQTVIGAAWALIQPVLSTGVFIIIFNIIAGIQSADIPYPVFAYLGMLYWNLFSRGLDTVSNSFLANQGVLSKIYFPRLIPPLSALIVGLVDFVVASSFFIVILIIYGLLPPLSFFIAIVPAIIMVTSTAFGAGLFFASLNVKYRDVRTALPFLVQLAFFLTPVIYPVSLVPVRFQHLIYLNPVAGALTLVRDSLSGKPINWIGTAVSCSIIILFIILGIWYFKKVEKKFVDII
jgi:lipopolysaccharide transport system permease protein